MRNDLRVFHASSLLWFHVRRKLGMGLDLPGPGLLLLHHCMHTHPRLQKAVREKVDRCSFIHSRWLFNFASFRPSRMVHRSIISATICDLAVAWRRSSVWHRSYYLRSSLARADLPSNIWHLAQLPHDLPLDDLGSRHVALLGISESFPRAITFPVPWNRQPGNIRQSLRLSLWHTSWQKKKEA